MLAIINKQKDSRRSYSTTVMRDGKEYNFTISPIVDSSEWVITCEEFEDINFVTPSAANFEAKVIKLMFLKDR